MHRKIHCSYTYRWTFIKSRIKYRSLKYFRFLATDFNYFRFYVFMENFCWNILIGESFRRSDHDLVGELLEVSNHIRTSWTLWVWCVCRPENEKYTNEVTKALVWQESGFPEAISTATNSNNDIKNQSRLVKVPEYPYSNRVVIVAAQAI